MKLEAKGSIFVTYDPFDQSIIKIRKRPSKTDDDFRNMKKLVWKFEIVGFHT